MAHVFISYKREDSHFARLLKYELEKADFELWIDTERLLEGEDWRQGIDEAIQDAYAVLVIMSPKSSISSYVTYEWAYALGIGVAVIPLLIETTEFHPRLDVLHRFDFRNSDPALQPWSKLISRLNDIQHDNGINQIRIPRNAPREIRQIMEVLNSWHPDEREKAATVLGKIGNPIAVHALTKLFDDRELSVAIAAIWAVKAIGDKIAIPSLIHALKNPNKEIAFNAARVLNTIGDESILPSLIEALQDDDERIAASAALGLGIFGGETIVPFLSQTLWSIKGRSRVTSSITEALKNIGTQAAIDVMNEWYLYNSY